MRRGVFSLVFLIGLLGMASATTYYVNPYCSSSCNGSSLENGFLSVSIALQDSNVGDGDGDVLYFYPTSSIYQSVSLSSDLDNITFEGNGAEIHADLDVNNYVDDIKYKWLPSQNASRAGWYYLIKNTTSIEKILNGEFNIDTTNWLPAQTDTYEVVYDSALNSTVLHLEESTGSYFYQTISLEAKVYNYSFKVKGNTDAIVELYQQGGGERYYLLDSFVNESDGWIEYSGTVNVTVAYNYFFRLMNGISNYEIWFDDFSVFESLNESQISEPSDLISITPDSVEFKNSSSNKPEDWSWFASSHSDFHPTSAANPIDNNTHDGYSNYDGFLSSSDRHNWGYGDLDSLGFNTLYIYLAGEKNPNNYDDLEIWVPNTDYVIRILDGSTGHNFNNLTIKGGNGELINSLESFNITNSILENCDNNAILLQEGNLTATYNKFINTGHRTVNVEDDGFDIPRVVNYYNNFVFGTHIFFLLRDDNLTLNFQNSASESLCYGVADYGLLTNMNLNQNNNQYSADPICHDGGQLQLQGTGVWEYTDITDIPSNISTIGNFCRVFGDEACGTPEVDNRGIFYEYNSQNIDAGTDVGLSRDFDGNPIYGTPDIGAFEYQPPYTMGTSEVPGTGSFRVYSDGKFRNLTTGTSKTFSIIPEEGYPAHTSTQLRNASYDVEFTNYTSFLVNFNVTNQSVSGNVNLTVCNLTASRDYALSIDSVLSATYTSDSSGCVDFQYTGSWSEHEFKLELIPMESSEDAPSSSGGSSSYSGNLENGFQKYLREGLVFLFVDDGESHKIKLNKFVDEDTVEMVVSSEPVSFEVSIGEIKKVDYDDDGFYDLSVELRRIVNSLADVFITSIDEKVLVDQENEEVVLDEEEEVDLVDEVVEEESCCLGFVVGFIVVLLVVFGYWFFGMRGKKRR